MEKEKATENYIENFADKITPPQQRITIIVHERNEQQKKIEFVALRFVLDSVLVSFFSTLSFGLFLFIGGS